MTGSRHSLHRSPRGEDDEAYRLATAGRCLAHISHEIRNLLTPVSARVESTIANGSAGSKDLRATLEFARDGLAAAGEVCDAILSLVSNDYEGSRASVERAARAAMLFLPMGPGPSIQVQVPHDLEVAVSEVVVQQVLLNLLLNAHAAAGADGWIIVRAKDDAGRGRVGTQSSGHVAVEITNSCREHGRASGDDRSAHGLGLQVCESLLDRFGGELQVDFQDLAVKRVTLTLPKAVRRSQRAAA